MNYDWNRAGNAPRPVVPHIAVCDQTLSDQTSSDQTSGDRTPSDGREPAVAREPSLEEKVVLLGRMADVGIESAGLGRMRPDGDDARVCEIAALARSIADRRLPLVPGVTVSLALRDCERVSDVAQQAGIAVEVAGVVPAFPPGPQAPGPQAPGPVAPANGSPELADRSRAIASAADFATRHGLPFMLVIDDASRTRPEVLEQLGTAAVEAGARRICLTDSAGHATPAGARALVRFLLRTIRATGEDVAIDWSGRRDRGLAVACSLAAAEAGAVRLHATVLGLGAGPRGGAGPTALGVLLMNLHSLGWRQGGVEALAGYCLEVAALTGRAIPDHHPILVGNPADLEGGLDSADLGRVEAMATSGPESES